MNQRTKNFSEDEKIKFLEIFKEMGDISIVDGKRYDSASLEKKNKMWGSITATYNSQNVYPRNAKQLIVLHRDLKAKAKKDYAAEKLSMNSTGGGTDMVKISPIIESVIEIMPNSVLDQITGIKDSDEIFHDNSTCK